LILKKDTMKTRLSFKSKGREVTGGSGAYQMRESPSLYGSHFWAKKEDIGLENTCFRDIKIE
jgi:hypothetical protein